MGEYKGYGLSFVTDVLAGVMTGALFGLSVFQHDRHFDVGHQMLAIHPDAFLDRSDFEDRLEKLIEEVVSAAPIDPEQPVLLPGEMEHRRMEARRREGIPVDHETVAHLCQLARDLGIEPLD
jgi:LDH2 family malate/lactate/ureidoglycolate dehydrogenase